MGWGHKTKFNILLSIITMIRLRLLILFGLCALGPLHLCSQVEVHPYFGLLSTDVDLIRTDESGVATAYPSDRLLAGIDAHFGRRSLTPLVGVGYRLLNYEVEGGDPDGDRSYHVLSLPIGMVYRLFPADLDLNLVPHLALHPTYTWETFDRGSATSGLGWGLRTGVSVYIDWATVGLQYRYRFTDVGAESRSGLWALVVGFRL
jgi:hypothetical protein